MNSILNILTKNKIKYEKHSSFAQCTYLINISKTCTLKLYYIYSSFNSKYVPAMQIKQMTTNKELAQINNILNLIKPYLKQTEAKSSYVNA